MPAQQQAQAPTAKAKDVADLSLHEMLRVMDVARELRNDREMAERALARDDVRRALREKLMRTAELSGDRVTEQEIDAAIETYFANRHQYEDPKFSPSVFLAHLWVRRRMILAVAGTALITLGTLWALFLSPFAPLSSARQQERVVAAALDQSSSLVQQIRAMSSDPSIVEMAESLAAEARAAGRTDPTGAIQAQQQLAELHEQLSTTYSIQMAPDNDGTSLFESLQGNGELSGYYVVVQAVDSSGNVIPQNIRNAETGTTETVSRWAERIPKDVFDRLVEDKVADGVLDEIQFANKPRGRLDMEMVLPGSNGGVAPRTVQITQW